MTQVRALDQGTTHVADPERWSWADHAACAGLPLWLFYGHDGERESETAVREAAAKAVCELCPLATYRACREAALALRPGAQFGVQAGLSAEERISIRRNRMRGALEGARRKGAA